MTYRELIKVCYETPYSECKGCIYNKECAVFRRKANRTIPYTLYEIMDIVIDAEIEVIE